MTNLPRRHPYHFLALALCLLIVGNIWAADDRPLEFQVTFDKAVSPAPFTGRVYVMLSKQRLNQPPSGPNWFQPEPFFAVDVKDWKPGEAALFAEDALGYPTPLSKLAAGTYWALAVMDFDRGSRSFGAAEGNGYSKAMRLELDPKKSGPVQLHIDQVYHERPFQETERVKLVDVESKLLSAFEGRPVRMRAGVVLPKSYGTEPARKYPVIYEIPGFGGTHSGAFFAAARGATDVECVEMLYVVLDPSCRLGHHVFADSANNGPRGQALVEELIPHIEKTYRGLGTPGARFVTGHSSGGWSSLWLQVTYPDFFGGVWSTAPDPVDFRDFQRINIYQPGVNMFTDEAGKPRPLARGKSGPAILYKAFSDMEYVTGHGGQLASFEAVFSPRGPDGKPLMLWDRKTGAVDPQVAKSWERYDIHLVLERNWKALAPKLAGKLHVYMGAEDTFYLEGAVVLLKQALASLGSDAVVEIFPGRDHGTLMNRALRQRIAKEMATQFQRAAPAKDK
jgi:S-formylglutathione hydrolase FrmB